jgi:hypothetical protein
VNASAAGYERVRCVAHVHSTHSDGSATLPELRAAAREAGARVVLLTDHDTLGARDAGEDGWGDDVLVVVGHEVSPRGGHLLVFGTDEVVPHRGRDEREILDAVAAAGGFGYAAHPFSLGSAISTRVAPAHAWGTFRHPALAGIEVWSLTTDVSEGWRSAGDAVRDMRNPLRTALAGPPERHLREWDALTAAGDVLAGLGGQDAHARGVRVRGRVRSIMPHDRWMGLVQTELALDTPFTGDDEADRASVLAALRAGRTTIVVPPLGDPLGARIAYADGRLSVAAPEGTLARIVTPGAAVRELPAPCEVDVAGPVRVELLRSASRWILSSPLGGPQSPSSS